MMIYVFFPWLYRYETTLSEKKNPLERVLISKEHMLLCLTKLQKVSHTPQPKLSIATLDLQRLSGITYTTHLRPCSCPRRMTFIYDNSGFVRRKSLGQSVPWRVHDAAWIGNRRRPVLNAMVLPEPS
ncbi:hypothetical protein VTJ04DRAFT_8392 [Mycothermus thermophilus]|uniref:uncharacterized protein n=1 Tax=Humicola insolens TaxID=85995 RepID=UPI003742F35C